MKKRKASQYVYEFTAKELIKLLNIKGELLYTYYNIANDTVEVCVKP